MARLHHPARMPIEQLLSDCEVRRQRRSGPGGQHRNKVETGIFMKHLPTGVSAAATEKRSQAENKKAASERLRIQLAIKHRVEVASDDEPHDIWNSRIRGGRIVVSPSHFDFAIMLAEALDFLQASQLDFVDASERLRCTRSQLTKLLKIEPAAFQFVNESRRDRDLPPLK